MEKKTKHILIYSGLALVAAVVAYKYITRVKATSSGSSSTTYIDSNGNVVVVPGGGNTSGGLNFKGLADAIFNAYDGWGTDVNSATTAFSQLKSDADMDALIAAYGVRTVSSGIGNIFESDYKGDLFGATKSELSDSDVQQLNTMLRNHGVTKVVV